MMDPKDSTQSQEGGARIHQEAGSRLSQDGGARLHQQDTPKKPEVSGDNNSAKDVQKTAILAQMDSVKNSVRALDAMVFNTRAHETRITTELNDCIRQAQALLHQINGSDDKEAKEIKAQQMKNVTPEQIQDFRARQFPDFTSKITAPVNPSTPTPTKAPKTSPSKTASELAKLNATQTEIFTCIQRISGWQAAHTRAMTRCLELTQGLNDRLDRVVDSVLCLSKVHIDETMCAALEEKYLLEDLKDKEMQKAWIEDYLRKKTEEEMARMKEEKEEEEEDDDEEDEMNVDDLD